MSASLAQDNAGWMSDTTSEEVQTCLAEMQKYLP
jgi:hypothetical protein